MARRIKRERCSVCGRFVARNWLSREMAMHRERFTSHRSKLLSALPAVDPNRLHGSEGELVMQHVLSLNHLLPKTQ